MSSLTKRSIPNIEPFNISFQNHEPPTTPIPIYNEPDFTSSINSPFQENEKKPPVETQSWTAYFLPFIVNIIFISGFFLVYGILIPYGFETLAPKIIHGIIGLIEFVFVLYSFWKGVTVNPGIVHPTWDRIREITTDSGVNLNSPILNNTSLNINSTGIGIVVGEHASRIIPQNETDSNLKTSRVMTSGERLRLLMLEPNHDKTPRYCEKCKCYKPPRAHHSTFYGKCVLKYDHYCIWLNNTIGHYNYRYFFLFLMYTVSIWIHFLFGASYILISLALNGNVEDHPVLFILTLMFGVVMVPMGFLVAMFFGWHVWLLLTNQTSVEKSINGDTVNLIAKYKKKNKNVQHRIKFTNIYSTTFFNNIATSLGTDWRKWFIPIFNVELGDGIRFQTISEDKRIALQEYLFSISAIPKDEDDLYDDYEDNDSSDDGSV